jgi:serine protease
VKKSHALRTLATLGAVTLACVWLHQRGHEATVPAQTHDEAAAADATDDPDVVPDELVVDFRDDEPHDRIAALGRELGVTFTPASSYYDADEVYTVDTPDVARVLAALRANPDVEAADPQVVFGLPEDALAIEDQGSSAERVDPSEKGFPNDPKFGLQWHLGQIHAKDTWKAAQGDGVIVAVIDTGVARVPDLAQTQFVPGFNFVNNTADATDDHGHGTHVAGTIAQSTHNGIGVAGVAFFAKIMPIKVLSARGSGSVSGIAEGIRWATDHGAKVINMSLGGGMNSSVLAKAVKYAHDKGVVVVCAAGNDGRGKVSYPAANVGAIAVAATQFDESTTFYSNWGKEIDVAAPGGNTRVDQNGDGFPDGVLQNTVVPGDTKRNDYLWFMGTSMASPHVAGVAALVVSQGVTDPDAVEKVLKDTARMPKNAKNDGNRYGAGIVDASAAVKRAHEFGGYELGIALGAFALIALRLRRLGLAGVGLGAAGVASLIMGSSGLFFLGGLGLPGATFFAHGVPEWDMVLGAAHHGSLLAYSAALPLAAFVLGIGFKRARGVIAGLAIGVGAHLLFHVFFHTATIGAWWLVPNALACFGLGYLALRK